MLRRILSRLKRVARAPFVPWTSLLSDLVNSGPTLAVTARSIGTAAWQSIHRLLKKLSRDPQPLTVGVDITPFYEPLTGVGWYLFHLLEELARDPSLRIVPFGDPSLTDHGPSLHAALPAGLKPVVFDLRGRRLSRFSRPIVLAAFAVRARLEGCALFFGANYFLPRSLGAIAGRRVVTVHDLTFRRFPELMQAETLANLQLQMERELMRSDAVICVSEATRRDLLTYFSIDDRKAITIHSGLAAMNEDGPATSLPLPSRYVLFVSTIEPRKNLETLVEAFEELKRRGEYEGSLVIVGKVGWKSDTTMRRISDSPWSRFIIHLDYLSRAQLASVYRRAEVFVLPSHHEGFGFTLLEAMAMGVATIAARSSSLPEIGGDAALYFAPARADQLAAQIRRLTSDLALRKKLIEAGLAQAAKFQWSRTAQATAAVFRRVAGDA